MDVFNFSGQKPVFKGATEYHEGKSPLSLPLNETLNIMVPL